MKRPTMLVETLLRELGRDLDLSVERDIAVMRYRCEHEGLSFLTITLPLLSDALERGLEDGCLRVPSNFARDKGLPRFLGGFFRRVFARTGEPLPDIDPDCIFAIRQICRFFKKLKIACTGDREDLAAAHYLEVERELGLLTPSIGRKDYYLDTTSRILWSQVFPEIDPLEVVCQHGPGYTADRVSLNRRNQIDQWYDRSELTFPSDLHVYPNYGYAAESSGVGERPVSDGLQYLGIRDEPGVRVVFVPKTQTSPRVIAMEPVQMQYMQQGLMHYIVPRLESHRLTKSSIRFTDQTPNQRLAHRSSIDRTLSTIDLKDASDRVHFALVQRIFAGSGILEYLEDARSLHATLPDGTNVVLNKYASQGSALCFPVEAMVFYTLILSAFHELDGRRPSSRSIMQYSNMIDIYGDDIIVPIEYTDAVVRNLEAYGLKVNINKSFRSSLFRESCGGDYYNGYPVNPVYARQLPLDDVRSWTPDHVNAWVQTANLFYWKGLWSTSQAIRDMVEAVVRFPIHVSATKRGAGIYFESAFLTTGLRYNSSICGYEQKRIVYQPTKKKDDINGKDIACLNLWARGSGQIARTRSEKSAQFQITQRDRSFPCIVENVYSSSSTTFTGQSWINRSLTGPGLMHEEDVLAAPWNPTVSFESSEDYSKMSTYSTARSPFLTEGVDITAVVRTPLDFRSSVKRGAFKSKRRWVTLIT